MIHLVRGSGAAESLRSSLGLVAVVPSLDPFSVGPVAHIDEEPLSAWMGRRRAFWCSTPGEQEEDDQAAAGHLVRCLDSNEVTLWLGLGADDQLLGAWFCAQLTRLGRSPSVQIVQFTSSRSPRGAVRPVASIGLLSESELADHPPPVDLDRSGVERFARLWSAWTAREPYALVDLGGDSEPDAIFRQVANSLLDYFPDRASGLGRWDFAVLRHIHERGPKLTRAIGHTLSESQDSGDLIGDGWLFWRVRRLGSSDLAFPLLALDSESQQMRDVSVRLTPHGLAVLEAGANAVELNGIDDHVGGVHLESSTGRVWFRIPGGLVERGAV